MISSAKTKRSMEGDSVKEEPKEKYMVIVGFKGVEFNPLSFYSEGKPIHYGQKEDMVFNDPMQNSQVTIAGGTYSFFSTKLISEEEYEEHKTKVKEQEKMESMFTESMQPTGE